MALQHKGLDHIAIAVPDTGKALELWRDQVGLRVLFSEQVNDDTVLLTHLELGATQLQLVEPLVKPHPLWDWLEANGGAGLHHLCLAVENLHEAMQGMDRQTSLQPATNIHQGTAGKKALFLQPESSQGIRIELTGN